MPKNLTTFFSYLSQWKTTFVVLFLMSMSALALYTYFPTRMNLPYADAISRLDIARKVVDNLNPGLAQLGSVWLPLPQLLMVPFIWNEYMWHSGLAGALMSMTAYVVGGIYLYKSAYRISKSFFPSFCTLLVYALNINLFYLQTTAMSELLYICLLAIVVYYFLVWVDTLERKYLLLGGAAVAGITLIRYEGLALLFSSLGVVVLYTFVKTRNLKKIEGNVLLYCFVAFFGFALWTLYLTLIFHDPFFWLRYYGFDPTALVGAAAVNATPPPQAKPFMAAVWQYFTSVAWMTGLVPMLYAIVGLLIGIADSIGKKWGRILVLLLPFSVFLLMVMTLRRNTPVVQPNLSFENILSTQTSYQTGFNIRYGLMVFPWLALLSIYVFKMKKPWYIPTFFFLALFSTQIINHFQPRYTALYEIPTRILQKPDFDMVNWMKANYHGGYIMISASGFEDQMFAMGFPYRTFIHEGAGKYWTEALDRPARYADWVIVDFNRQSDWLAKELVHKQYWSWDYTIAWENESVKVYKIKTHPDIIIPEN